MNFGGFSFSDFHLREGIFSSPIVDQTAKMAQLEKRCEILESRCANMNQVEEMYNKVMGDNEFLIRLGFVRGGPKTTALTNACSTHS